MQAGRYVNVSMNMNMKTAGKTFATVRMYVLLACLTAMFLACAQDPERATLAESKQRLAVFPSPVFDDATCADLGCTGFAPPRAGASGKTRGSNSQTELPRHLFLGDFDGDGQADYLLYTDGRIFLTHADFEKTGVSHIYFSGSVARIYTGDFYGAGFQQACVQTERHLRCYGFDPAAGDFQLWFQQANFNVNTEETLIAASEDAIVADYDGDGRDEILLYDNSAGTYRMLEVSGNAFFSKKTDYDPGNLASSLRKAGVRVRAGDYDGDGRSDIFAVNTDGRLYVFRSTPSSGTIRSNFFFSTVSGFVDPIKEIMLARVDDDVKDDIVLHRTDNGGIAFYKVAFNGGRPPFLNIDQGQIKISTNSQLAMNYSHPNRNEPGSPTRDDAFVFDNGNHNFYKSEARYDASAQILTYWRAFNHTPPNYFGWPTPQASPIVFVKCRYSDKTTEPHTTEFYQALAGRIIDYFGNNTYGGLDLSYSNIDVDSWANMGITVAEAEAIPDPPVDGQPLSRRGFITNACSRAVFGSEVPSWYVPPGYAAVAMFVNTNDGIAAIEHYALLGPKYQDVWLGIQETAHALGWGPHSANDLGQAYGDAWDVMSGATYGAGSPGPGPRTIYTNPLGVNEGPGMNAFNRGLKSFIPPLRIASLPPGTRATYDVAALNHPEANGRLVLQLGTTPGQSRYDYYSVEYREPSEYDRAIGQATVLVHGVKGGLGTLITKDPATGDYTRGSQRMPGETLTTAEGYMISVISFDPVAHLAKVQVSN